MMFLDAEPPFFKKGDKVEIASNGMIGYVTKVTQMVRRVDDVYVVCGKMYSTFDIVLIERKE